MPVFLTPIVDLPRRIKEGDDLGAMIKARVDIRPGDAVIIASTLVSKSEGRRVRLQDITPSFRATQLAEESLSDRLSQIPETGDSAAQLAEITMQLVTAELDAEKHRQRFEAAESA